MLSPSKGFILITLPKTQGGFSYPEEKGNLRTGYVVAVGDNIIHASGKDLPSPVQADTTVIFQYLENQEIMSQGEKFYLVPFNLIAGYYEK